MALYDTADLLARCKRYAAEPAAVEALVPDDTVDAMWYALLTEAEAKWKPIFAAHDPGPMYSAPVQMTTSDGGVTYSIPDLTSPPLALEVYADSKGTPLIPGAYWDRDADYVQEGAKIRMTAGRSRSFADGPWARYVARPGAIDADTDSTIQPAEHRIVLVFDALERWASRGGRRDPSYFRALKQQALYGDPDVPGDIGILGAAKAANLMAGLAARPARDDRWYLSPDLDRMAD